MSETHRNRFNSRRKSAARRHPDGSGFSCSLLIAGAFLLLVIVFVVRVLSPSPPAPVAFETLPAARREVPEKTPAVFDAETFKRTIIDNNLFRPLGWTPPRPREPYRLIGTILPRSENTPPKAIIESTAGEKTYIVSIGETLDASTQIVDIQPKVVTLSTNGQQRTLHLQTAVYLNASAATRKPRRTTEAPHRQTSRRAPVRSKPTPAVPAVSTTQPPARLQPLSDWETREGEPIRFGDARLKNPQKWGLRRR